MVQKLVALFGIVIFILIAWLLSSNKKKVNIKTVVVALICEFLLAIPVFLFPQSRVILLAFSDFFTKILEAAREGIVFVFGALGASDSPQGFILIFQSLTYIIIFSALCSLLYYLRVLPFIIVTIAKFVKKIFGVTAVEAVCSASNLFVGIESFVSIRPYLQKLTRSQIFLIFTIFMSTIASSMMALYISLLNKSFPTIAGHLVSASILSIPAGIMISKIMEPETESPENNELKVEIPESMNTFSGSIINGANDGGKMVLGITVLLVAVVGVLGIVNLFLSFFTDVTLTQIIGYIFIPFTWLMGVQPSDVSFVSEILGTRLLMTEVPSYIALGNALNAGTISQHTGMISAYALCGFTSIESLSIATGAFLSLVPEKSKILSSLFYKILISATLTTLITGTVAGIFFIK